MRFNTDVCIYFKHYWLQFTLVLFILLARLLVLFTCRSILCTYDSDEISWPNDRNNVPKRTSPVKWCQVLVYDIDSQVFERIQSFLSRKKLIKIESKNIINQANQGFTKETRFNCKICAFTYRESFVLRSKVCLIANFSRYITKVTHLNR